MSRIVIHAENVSKRYRIGEIEQYRALRDVISGWASAPRKVLSSVTQPSTRKDQQANRIDSTLWALRDVII